MKKQIISFFPFLPTLQLNTILYHNSTLSLEQSLKIKASVTKIFSTKKLPKKICSLIVPIALDLPWMMQGFDEQ